jgi:sugar phosphate isomerase/epimerase
MITPALLSVTFRKLPAEDVVRLAAENGLRAIEWGGDIHAPPRDLAAVARVRDLTLAAGLSVCAYGSYYRIGVRDPAAPTFAEVLTAARTLGAPLIRVWVGNRASADISAAEFAAMVAEARDLADQAAAVGITIATEWHGGTLTDRCDVTLAFLRAVDRANFRTVWQPHQGQTEVAASADLAEALPWVVHLHVFSWWPMNERHPLAYREGAWRTWLAIAARAGRPLAAGLEFVVNDDPAVLPADATLLRAMIG